MLKRLAILGLLLLVSILAPIPGQTTSRPSEGSGNTNSNSQNQNGVPSPLVSVAKSQPPVNAEHAGQVAAKDSEHSVTLTSVPPLTISAKKKTFLDYVYEWGPWFFGLFLAIAGGIQLRLLRVTWKAIQEQKAETTTQTGILKDSVAATQKSADAAMAQIQLMKEQSHRMVENERARLKVRCDGVDVQGEFPGTLTLSADIWIANHGSSNAYITRKWGRVLVAPFGGTTPVLNDSCDLLLPYPFDIIKPEAEPIRVNLALEDAPSSFRDLCIGITTSRLTMHLYGFIEYETMGEGWHLPFRYKWVMPMLPDNISERDLANDINILGGWDDPGQQESGEYRINPN